MQNAIHSRVRCTAAVVLFVFPFTQFARAAPPQPARQQPPAPIERQAAQPPATAAQPPAAAPSPEAIARDRLLAAHTIYLARQTQDSHFPAGTEEAYERVAASLRAWGRYQLVDSVSQADLVLQLRDTVHAAVTDGTPPDYTASVSYQPSFQLTVADPSTLAPLWVVNVPVRAGLKKKAKVDLLAVSAENLVSQLKLLTGTPLTAQDQAAMKRVHSSHSHVALEIGVVAGAAAISLAILLTERQHQEHETAAFCAAHGISPCPGS